MGNILGNIIREVQNLRNPAPLDKLIVAVLARHGKPLGTKDEVAAIRKLQVQFDAVHASLDKFGEEHVKAEWLRRRGTIGTEAEDEGVLSRDSIKSEFAEKRRGIKGRLGEISAQAQPLAGLILDRLAEAATGVADRIEAEERATASEFSTDHFPSAVVTSIRQLASMRGRLVGGGLTPPKRMLAGVIEI